MPSLVEIERERAKRGLKYFIEDAWHVVEPGNEYIHNWHIGAICDVLEAAYRRDIRRLIINIPPRHMKSLTVSVFFPVWVWTQNPSEKFVYSSYAQKLSTRDSVKCRRLIQSDWFQQRWGDVFQLSGDTNLKTEFENDKAGHRIATSVGGTATGRGGNFIICDDPHNVKEGESETVRESTIEWWDLTMSTRMNNPKRDVQIVIMQRVHESDLAGHMLQQGGWTHLRIPGEYEYDDPCVIEEGGVTFEDPRENEGELLWPDRFGDEEIDDLKRRLGTYGYAGQIQQRPAPLEGGIVKRAWLNEWKWEGDHIRSVGKFGEVGPLQLKNLVRFGVVDLAVSEKEHADYTVIGAFAGNSATKCLYHIDQDRRHIVGPDLVRAIRAMVEKWNLKYVWVEKSGFQLAIVQQARRGGLPVRELEPDKDKMARLMAATPMMEEGRYWIPMHADWVDSHVKELLTFPNAEHDDQVDVAAYACVHWVDICNQSRGPISLGDAAKGRRKNPTGT